MFPKRYPAIHDGALNGDTRTTSADGASHMVLCGFLKSSTSAVRCDKDRTCDEGSLLKKSVCWSTLTPHQQPFYERLPMGTRLAVNVHSIRCVC